MVHIAYFCMIEVCSIEDTVLLAHKRVTVQMRMTYSMIYLQYTTQGDHTVSKTWKRHAT